MQDKLRRRYQVQKELSRSGTYEGEIAVCELVRLTSMLDSDQADIAVNFGFLSSGYDYPILKGTVETRLAIECQRCIKPIDLPMKFDFTLLIDAPDELVDEINMDTLYSEDGEIDLFEVIEDELILNLPLVALHEDDSCNKFWQNPEEIGDLAVKENPFLALKGLKTIN